MYAATHHFCLATHPPRCDDRVVPARLDATEVERLFRQHGALVYRRALRILGNVDDADEATQEVFVRILRKYETYEARGEVLAWLYRITTHYCLNRIRDRRRRRELFELHVRPSAATHSSASPADMLTLRWLLAEANEQQARAAVYVFLDGMSYREAAELLGVSKRTVGNLVERFRAWAREHLEAGAAR